MVPFRVYDKEGKKLWIVLNFHPNSGEYLVALEEEGEDDGLMMTISSADLAKYRLVDFLDEGASEPY